MFVVSRGLTDVERLSFSLPPASTGSSWQRYRTWRHPALPADAAVQGRITPTVCCLTVGGAAAGPAQVAEHGSWGLPAAWCLLVLVKAYQPTPASKCELRGVGVSYYIISSATMRGMAPVRKHRPFGCAHEYYRCCW